MKRIPLTALVLLTVSTVTALDIPSFHPWELVECDGDRIDVGSYGAPLAVDWNGDGMKDLLAGQFEFGRIRFYPNVGTSSAPVFENWSYLLDGTVPISVPYG